MANAAKSIKNVARILKIDQDDLALAAEASALRAAYGGHWGRHPEFPDQQWQEAVDNFDTRLGYWEWVANAQRGNEADPKEEPHAN